MAFQSFLQQPFSEKEFFAISQLEDKIGQLQILWNKLEASAIEQGLKKMAKMRLRASSTLMRGDCEGWVLANEYIQTKIQLRQAPEWKDICQLNRMMTKTQGGVVREQEIYTGSLKACPSSELNQTLKYFCDEILSSPTSTSALVHAALCQYWLVSIHPFNDGNGRTAILLADWLLAMGGYLPQTFSSKIDAVVMYIPEREKKMTPGMSVARILDNVERSYKCFEYG